MPCKGAGFQELGIFSVEREKGSPRSFAACCKPQNISQDQWKALLLSQVPKQSNGNLPENAKEKNPVFPITNCLHLTQLSDSKIRIETVYRVQ